MPLILQEMDSQNGALGTTKDYLDDTAWLTGETADNAKDTANNLDTAGGKAKTLSHELDNAARDRSMDLNVRVTGSGAKYATGGGTVMPMSAPSAAGRSVTVQTLNYYGTGDLTRDAKKLKRLLEAEDLEQGRDRGRPLAVAW